jgi:hypothetical protein
MKVNLWIATRITTWKALTSAYAGNPEAVTEELEIYRISTAETRITGSGERRVDGGY